MKKENGAKFVAPALLAWWDHHGRTDLPWQHDPTLYRVWVSEIMLQQTQVATVAGYYERFLNAFPDVTTLADAALDQVLHHWSGLGYYARARNLHRAAGIVRDDHDGKIPTDFDMLISLPGIGRSTAGAILALASNRRFAILDGNAKRVLSRVFCIEGWPGAAAVNRELWKVAEACTPVDRAAQYTQAIMDLGSSVCIRRNPDCSGCPLVKQCAAFKTAKVAQVPSPRPKRVRPQREVVLVMVVRQDGAILLKRRPNLGVWGGLWGFPEAGHVDGVSEWCRTQVGVAPDKIRVRSILRHSFTHFDLDMTPVEARVPRPAPRVMDDDQWLWYNRSRPAKVGLAAPVARLLKTVGEE